MNDIPPPPDGRTPTAEAVTLASGEAAPGPAPSFGEYELVEELARGGMGVVYKARQTRLGRTVALKMILAGQLASPADVQRFRAEAEAAANLDHPHIVPIYEVGEHDGRHFFSMKLIEGGNLTGRVAEFATDPRAAARLVAAVARAVHHAHQRGLLHRDLKPANILLDAQGEPHVTDFGLVRRLEGKSNLTQSGAIVGTPSYMAPEQAAARKDPTTAVDVYSLGAVLYELLTGRPPFQGPSPLDVMMQVMQREPERPRRFNTRLDADLETICLKCLDKDPAHRYHSAAALADDLERWLRGEPILARPAGAARRLAKWARRRPALAALMALVVLVSAVGAAGIVWKWHDALAAEQAALAAERDALTQAAVAEEARAAAVRAQAEEKAAREHAEIERGAKQTALERADGLRLAAESSVARQTDPALALLLALEAVPRASNYLAYGALYDALHDCREERTLTRLPPQRFVRFSPDGRTFVTAGDDQSAPRSPRDKAAVARVWDAANYSQLASWPGYGMNVGALDLSPDGRRVAVALAGQRVLRYPDGRQPDRYLFTDRTAYVWEAATGRDLLHLRGHRDRIVSVAFSPDGRRLLTASWDHTARLWDADTGKELRTLQGHECSLASALFSPDGRKVLTLTANYNSQRQYPDGIGMDPGLPDRGPAVFEDFGGGGEGGFGFVGEGPVARLWDSETGEALPGLTKNRPAPLQFGRVWHPTSAAFSPDGARLAIGFEEDDAAVWDMAKGGAEQCVLRGHRGRVNAVAFSPDGRRVATAGRDGSARVWDAATGHELLRLFTHSGGVSGARFSADGQRLLTASVDGTARLWDVQVGAELAVLRGHGAAVEAAVFSPDGRHVVTAGDTTVRAWGTAPPAEAARVLAGHTGPVHSLLVTPDGRRLISAGKDGMPRVWDVATGQPRPIGEGKYLGEVRAAQLTADGRRLLTGSLTRSARVSGKEVNAGAVHLWDVGTGDDLCTLKDLPSGARAARLSPDGRTIVTVSDGYLSTEEHGLVHSTRLQGSEDPLGTTCLWDAGTGKLLARLPRVAWPFFAPAFSPDGGRVLLIANDDRSACLFDTRAGQELLALRHQAGPAGGVAFAVFSPDGAQIVSAGQDRTVCLWDAKDGRRLSRLAGFEQDVHFAAFSPDGGLLLTLSGKAAHVWDLADGRLLRPLTGHEGALTVAVFSADGQRVLAGTTAGSAVLWDVAAGRIAGIYRGHAGPVTAVALLPDGRQLATGGADGLVRLWPVDLLSVARQRLPRLLTPEERQRYDLTDPALLRRAADGQPIPANAAEPHVEPGP
jgi:WD40 repeat protein/tRNA A-37 threonylcarbamoyl transferase component Bud32